MICDEATSALDAVTQRKVLDLLLRLHRDRQLSLIMISHDMNVLRYMSHRVAVLFQGALVEVAPTAEFFAASPAPAQQGARGSGAPRPEGGQGVSARCKHHPGSWRP